MAAEFGLIIIQIVAGALLADFASGVFHWLEDAYGDESWPIIGPIVIEPNIRHHYSPLDFARVSYWKRNRAIIAIGVVFLVILAAVGWLNLFSITFLAVASQANETHRWAHLPTNQTPALVRRLQQLGIFQSPQHHWRHHRKPFDVHYCTITNFVNPLLDRIRFFRGLEAMIRFSTGAEPRQDTGKKPTAVNDTIPRRHPWRQNVTALSR